MKQVLENLRSGDCYVEDVPVPRLQDGCVLVRNHYSLISSGTEGGTVKLGQMSLVGKAKARPEQARKVIQLARTQGALTAYQVAMRALEMPVVLGYCSAGEVLAAAADVTEFAPGDLVACGGAGFANHAEIVCVPKNLTVKVPDGVDLRHAAFTTLGSIALQGVRIADARVGEQVVVIGLGLVGLLTVQILKAAGCQVFGVDVDPKRVDFVEQQGLCLAGRVDDSNLKERVDVLSGGIGADSVIVTATTNDAGPIAMAGDLARYKGRVVVVGRTEMNAPRETYLFKELQLCTSLAYGPGTGDAAYEIDGIDYPPGYVRWTENRNMGAFLRLIGDQSVDAEKLVSHLFDVDQAGRAFELISGKSGESSTAVLLHYPRGPEADSVAPRVQIPATVERRVFGEGARIGVVGAGSYATNEFLPLLAKEHGVQFRGIASATGMRAKALGKKYGFAFCSAEAEEVLNDEHTDCVFILTRHDTHAPLAAQALELGKHVFVEKPLALTHQELAAVKEAHAGSGLTIMVGYNRRYAALAMRLKELFTPRAQPMSILYRANVGYRPPDHWLHDPRQGGGVILGEACHHIDFCNWLVGSPVRQVSVETLGSTEGGFIPEDNVHILLQYQDGSLATVAYLSNGSKAYSAERIEVSADNKLGALTDFKQLEFAQGQGVRRSRLWLSSDKGHRRQIQEFLSALGSGGRQPIDTASYFSSSAVAIAAAMQPRRRGDDVDTILGGA